MSLLDKFNDDDDYGGGSGGGYYGNGRGGGSAGYGGASADDSFPADDETLGHSGFVNTRAVQEEPLFEKRRLDISCTSTLQFTHMVAGSGVVLLAMSSNRLLRVRLAGQAIESREELDLARKPEDRVTGLFMDPTASHVLVCVFNTREKQHETIYFAGDSPKGTLLKKWKGFGVTAIAWNPQAPSDGSSTREILVGTDQGLVHEAEIAKQDKYVKQVFRLEVRHARPSSANVLLITHGAGHPAQVAKPEPVTSLRLEAMASTADGPQWFAIVASAHHLFQFIGTTDQVETPVFAPLFARKNPNRRYFTVPGDVADSTVAFHAQFPSPPTVYAWLAACGVSYGTLDLRHPTTLRARDETVLTAMTGEPHLWKFPVVETDSGRERQAPVGLAITEFHIIMLFPAHFESFCLLSRKMSMTEGFPIQATRAMLGMAVDPVMETMLAFSSKTVYIISPRNETRDVWQLYLDKGMFTEALQYCGDKPEQIDKVTTAQAESLMAAGQYVDAARLWAKTQRSFEEVALRFIQVNQPEALKMFLTKKMMSLAARDKTQLTMLCTWLVEIYLNTLNSLKDGGDDSGYRRVQDEFRNFLQMDRVQQNLDKPTAYDLIASHGNVDDLTFFAILIEDYERVILHHVQAGAYTAALAQLAKQPSLALYYRFAPTLLSQLPRETVDAFMQRPTLDPRLLIPAFIRYQQNAWAATSGKGHQAIRYLEWCVGDFMKNRDPAIHNYLISLYAKLPTDDLLIEFLDKQGSEPVYDLKYALRLCMQEGKQRACVAIYSAMSLYEEAVELALKVDLDLARKNANMPADDAELRKKLWLRIARHIVQGEKDVKKAMAVLHECELLKIEDILPFFPDFVTIDHFKDAICASLEEYNRDIEKLKGDMNSATASALHIRGDIHDLRHKYSVIGGDETCGLCTYPLLSRAFYVFPCQHGFHGDCLTTEAAKQMKPATKRRLDKLQAQLVAGASQQALSDAKTEIDEIVAEECLFCGEMMIASIDVPFIAPEQQDELLRSWTLPATAGANSAATAAAM